MSDAELNALAHTLAYDMASSLIGGECLIINDKGELFGFDLDSANNDPETNREIAECVRYLEACGLIERHADNPNWIALRDESEATR
jgi:hypothetical protein